MKLLAPQTRDLGAFTVRRVLPAAAERRVGPFVFFDHIGPAVLPAGRGVDVHPHPHIGLATVTYLFEGAILHRDSLGFEQLIRPGDVNWMTAGRGIVHSERSRPEDLAAAQPLHGLQIWVGLPLAHEDAAPAFSHHPAATLPTFDDRGVRGRLIVGTYAGLRAPPPAHSPIVYAALEFAPAGEHRFLAEHPERAVYAIDDGLTVDGVGVPPATMAVLAADAPGVIRSRAAARAMLVGGAPLDGERLLWWNFVASSRERLESAKAEWRAYAIDGSVRGTPRFGAIAGDAEWIPLPE